MKPNIDLIRALVNLLWKVKSKVKVVTMPNEFIMFTLGSENDRDQVWSRPWFFKKRGMIMEKWYSGFDPKKTRIMVVPIWMTLPGLSMEF